MKNYADQLNIVNSYCIVR